MRRVNRHQQSRRNEIFIKPYTTLSFNNVIHLKSDNTGCNYFMLFKQHSDILVYNVVYHILSK